MRVSGACHCGAIAYTAEIDPEKVGICHCTDCQQLTGSAFRVSVGTTREQFSLLRGSATVYVKTGDAGTRRAQAFCAHCGSPLFTWDVDRPDEIGLRIGCIAQRFELRPSKQIWCRSALPWSMDLRELPRSDREEPPSPPAAARGS